MEFLCEYIEKIDIVMANNHDYGKKGGCVGKGLLYLVLVFILLIWIYWKNQNGLPQ